MGVEILGGGDVRAKKLKQIGRCQNDGPITEPSVCSEGQLIPDEKVATLLSFNDADCTDNSTLKMLSKEKSSKKRSGVA